MNRRRFIVAGSLGVLSAGCSVSKSSVQSSGPAGLTLVQERKAMPGFSLPDLDGHTVRSADLTGNVAILRFWATW
jgi:AhpC/TSA family